MKKLWTISMSALALVSMCTLALVSCKNEQTETQVSHERDSLMQIISQKDDELNDLMGSINEVQEGFQRINEAEGRITIANGNPESASSREEIRENMTYIQDAMQQNREMIAKLQQKLKTSSFNAAALQKTIENLQTQLEEQNQRIQELEASLAEKDNTIAQQGQQIDNLNTNVSNLTDENNRKAQTVAKQDKELNKAWFVFGTKAELKEQKILKSGDVLKSDDFNKNYFTEIDIRTMKEIKLYSKKAQLLTSHPAGTYTLEKDAKGEFTLKITNPTKFWSVSKYLVIQVR